MPRTFRSKSLSANLETCLLRTYYCLPWTRNPVTLACRGGRFDLPGYGRRLAQLKSDLRTALTEVEIHEKAIARPVEQGARLALAELEEGLKEMLQQVERKKRSR